MWLFELKPQVRFWSRAGPVLVPQTSDPHGLGGPGDHGNCLSRLFRVMAAVLLCGLLVQCGFHVRGDAALPFRTLAIVGGENSFFVVDLKRSLRGNARVGIVDTPEQADAVLHIISNVNDKSILTLSGGGRVREFQLTQKVMFRVADPNGKEWMPTSEISVRRDFSFNDSQALAKEGEERLLIADMQADAVQQLLRRLSAAKRPG